jgi:hypothetical protein
MNNAIAIPAVSVTYTQAGTSTRVKLMTRDKTHIVAMTGSYFRGDAEAVLHPDDEARFDTVTYTYNFATIDEIIASPSLHRQPIAQSIDIAGQFYKVIFQFVKALVTLVSSSVQS